MPWREVGSETRGRHLETGTEANTMKNIVYWFFFFSMACSSCFLIPPWTTWPEHYLQPWAGPSYINHWIQKINPQSCLQGNVMEALPQLNFVFPDGSSLCQVNKNLTNTMPMMLKEDPKGQPGPHRRTSLWKAKALFTTERQRGCPPSSEEIILLLLKR